MTRYRKAITEKLIHLWQIELTREGDIPNWLSNEQRAAIVEQIVADRPDVTDPESLLEAIQDYLPSRYRHPGTSKK